MVSVYKLSELCNIAITDVRASRSYHEPGDFDVVGNGQNPRGRHNVANVPAKTIIVSRTGCFGHISRYPNPVFLTNEAFYLSCVSPIVDPDYLYYYLKYINPWSIKRTNYRSWKGLSVDKVSSIIVCLPNFERQLAIVEAYGDFEASGSQDDIWLSEKIKASIEQLQQIAMHTRKTAVQKRRKDFDKPTTTWWMWATMILVALAITIILVMDETTLHTIHREMPGWPAFKTPGPLSDLEDTCTPVTPFVV